MFLSLDQGTTSSRAILFDEKCKIICISQEEFTQHYPQPGWVEHDAEEIWETQLRCVRDVVAKAGISPDQIKAIGITNQRETCLIWDKISGKPMGKAIVWQDRRTAGLCDELKGRGLEPYVKETTGLVIDAYFSGTKIKYALEHYEGVAQALEEGNVLAGTIDSWLLWKLTGGKVHATDYSNASRTMLFNINTLQWDSTMLNELSIPSEILPTPLSSSGVFGYLDESILGAAIPISGIAGDQQSALFGQCCFGEGMAKNTYGTGCFMLMNTGEHKVNSPSGLLTTIAWGLGGKVTYALEGSVFVAGAAVQWLRDELQIISSSSDTEHMAMSIPDNGGVYFVPAFVGLGTPHWDMYARGTITGLTRGSNRNHIVRAALEAMAYQTNDVLDTMEKDSGISLTSLRVDGGASNNNFLMQFQADILGVEVDRPANVETTALGAALLAGLGIGFWSSTDEMASMRQVERKFTPIISEQSREKLRGGWRNAIEKTKT